MEEYSKEGKTLHATSSLTIRGLVDKVNSLKIKREDVVTLVRENGYYVLLYYYLGV